MMADPTDDAPKEGKPPESSVEDTYDPEQSDDSVNEFTPDQTSEPMFQTNAGSSDQSFEIQDEDHLLQQMAGIYVLWWNWAYFEIKVVKPALAIRISPRMLMPEKISGTHEIEFVYPICDFGRTLSTSKASEMFSVGMSMCKLYYTIEKMIFILIERLKEDGVDGKTEVQVMFEGHLLCQRKAFESIINLSENVVVTNFDPSTWGEQYLEIVKRMADKGFGYPTEAPRTIYKLNKSQAASVKQRS